MGVMLVWTILIPLIGALVVLLATPRSRPELAGPIALIGSLLPLGLVIAMVRSFNFATCNMPAVVDVAWIQEFGLRFTLGMDTISLWLVVLTAVLTPISVLASFKYIKQRQPEFYAWLLILHAGMLGVFMAQDVLLFYFFFEFTLIPMFFIIGIWGGADRRNAAGKFFLFTFSGSVLTLASLIYLAFFRSQFAGAHPELHLTQGLSFALSDLYAIAPHVPVPLQYVLFLGMLAGFAVKVPLFPVHTWLPLAHTEAPTAGSVILAGVLLKLGTYGILRFAIPIFPVAAWHYAPIIGGICVVGIIYGALVSWVQQDMKKLIAYSSVSHLAFCVLGMFALTKEGITGSVMYMINHGLSTGALFLVVGMIYERYHTRDMNQLSGLVRRLPALGFFAIFFVFSSVALPGLNGFISEFLCLIGTFVSGRSVGGMQQGNLGPAYAIVAATGVILGAVYMLYWAGKIIYGPLKEPHGDEHHEEGEHAGAVQDLSFREWAVLSPIAVLVVVLGVAPNWMMTTLKEPVEGIAKATWVKSGVPDVPAGQEHESHADARVIH